MLKKMFICTFSILLLFNINISSSRVAAATDTSSIGTTGNSLTSTVPGGTTSSNQNVDITSPNMYGTGYRATLQFSPQVCANEFNSFSKSMLGAIQDANYGDFHTNDGGWWSSLINALNVAKDVINAFNGMVFDFVNSITDALFRAGCYLGIAPSQFLQMMFFPVVLDNLSFLKDLAPLVQAVSISVLAITTVLAIYEMNKREGNIGMELIGKVGKFLLAAGIIAFSTYVLQGIYDIANVLGYLVSNYQIDIKMPVMSGHTVSVTATLFDYPTIFISYLEIAFSPVMLNSIPQFTGTMLTLFMIIKFIFYIFMIKDLSKIAVYGCKRIVTLVSAPILIPVLAGLIPSKKTEKIFTQYFRTVVAGAFVPVIFGLIYLASAPFIIQNLLSFIDAPVLKIIVLLFFLNILASLPAMAEGILGYSHSVQSGTEGALTAGVAGFALGTARNHHSIKQKAIESTNKRNSENAKWNAANPSAKSLRTDHTADTSFRTTAKTQLKNSFWGKK